MCGRCKKVLEFAITEIFEFEINLTDCALSGAQRKIHESILKHSHVCHLPDHERSTPLSLIRPHTRMPRTHVCHSGTTHVTQTRALAPVFNFPRGRHERTTSTYIRSFTHFHNHPFTPGNATSCNTRTIHAHTYVVPQHTKQTHVAAF